ncbi:MAG: hypothetical protein ACR5LF_09165 [Symbiopectobacterium sp.]
MLQDKPEPFRTSLALLIDAPVVLMADVRKRVKQLRHAIAACERSTVPLALIGCVGAATRCAICNGKRDSDQRPFDAG